MMRINDLVDRKKLIQQWIVPAVLVLSAVVWSFWDVLKGLYIQWMTNEDFSYGVLIPLIALYLVWEKRKSLSTIMPELDLRGILVMVGAIGLYIVGDLGAELFARRVAVITFCIGAVWWLYGQRVLRALVFPLMLLFLMLPLPGIVYRNLTFSLQIFSSKISVALLNALGFLAYREGNIIDMGFGQFQVVEACNGLRFIMPMLTMGFLFAFFRPQVRWKRLALIGVTIPLAMLTNVLRIVGTGILAKYFGDSVAQGFFHDFSGWAVFMASFICFGLFAVVLNKLPGKAPLLPLPAGDPSTGRPDFKRRMLAAAIAFIICLVSPIAVNVLGSGSPVALKRPLDHFPLHFCGRSGEAKELDTDIWKNVGGDSYVMIDYQKAGEPTINFYTAYYEIRHNSGDFIHNPMRCIPGGGWIIKSDQVRSLVRPNSSDRSGRLRVSEYIIEKAGVQELVYFWFQGRGRNSTNEFMAKLYAVWDGIWRDRTDGALVRVIMPLSSAERIDEARRILDPFALEVSQELDHYLP